MVSIMLAWWTTHLAGGSNTAPDATESLKGFTTGYQNVGGWLSSWFINHKHWLSELKLYNKIQHLFYR